VYHLSYQEELWAATEEKTEMKKTSKKNKNKKRKEKAKQKKTTTPPVTFAKGVKEGSSKTRGGKDAAAEQSRSSTVSTTSDNSDKQTKDAEKETNSPFESQTKQAESKNPPSSSKPDENNIDNASGTEDEKQNTQPAIDFVLYLQQTGSIIALAKLMDALEYGEEFDEGLDDSELKLIREQQMLSRQATT
jgi:hypothetical protein